MSRRQRFVDIEAVVSNERIYVKPTSEYGVVAHWKRCPSCGNVIWRTLVRLESIVVLHNGARPSINDCVIPLPKPVTLKLGRERKKALDALDVTARVASAPA